MDNTTNSKKYFPLLIDKRSKGTNVILRVLNAETFELETMDMNRLLEIMNETYLDYSTYKYNNSERVSLLNCMKVLVYDDTENDLYGVMVFISNKQRLWWVPKDILDDAIKNDKNLEIMNTSDLSKLYKVDSSFKAAYFRNNSLVYRTRYARFAFGNNISVDELNMLIGRTHIAEAPNKDAVDVENAEEIETVETVQEAEKTVQTVQEENSKIDEKGKEVIEDREKGSKIGEKEESKVVEREESKIVESSSESKVSKEIETEEKEEKKVSSGIKEILQSIVDREIALNKLKDELDSREQFLTEKEKEINEREYALLMEENISNGCEKYDCEVVFDGKADSSTEYTESKTMYEMILRVLKHGDTVTIPFDVFKKFHVSITSKALERNSSYTKYTQLATMRVTPKQRESWLVMIEVDEENPVKVTVLNEYGVQDLNIPAIQKYEVNYRQWRREKSFIR